MRYYPMFLNLEGRHCLVVGAGPVGVRKAASLLQCRPASVTVVDPAAPGPGLAAIAEKPGFRFEQRPFDVQDLDGVALAIAATADADVNRRVASECRHRNIPCNIADAPELSDFIVPSTISRGDLVLAVSTGGASPALAKRIRREMEEAFGPEYDSFLALMAALRPLVLDLDRPTPENTALFRSLVESALLDALKTPDPERAASILRELLPATLHPRIEELVHDIA